ncbi:hypothetical protein ACFX16_017540 [Malus domestica]
MLLVTEFQSYAGAQGDGVNYSRQADNLPTPEVIEMPFTGHLRKWGTKVEVVVISETRWPSQGEGEEPANIENAKTYNTNLIKHGQVGTPKRPG